MLEGERRREGRGRRKVLAVVLHFVFQKRRTRRQEREQRYGIAEKLLKEREMDG